MITVAAVVAVMVVLLVMAYGGGVAVTRARDNAYTDRLEDEISDLNREILYYRMVQQESGKDLLGKWSPEFIIQEAV